MNLEKLSDDIIDLYVNKGMTTVDISKIYGCSDSGVGGLLKRHGIKRIHTPNELHITNKQAEDICALYQSGLTTIEIGHIYGICDGSVAKILRQNDIEIRKGVRRSLVKRHDYFHNIDSIDKAYFLGWMISDGAIIQQNKRPNRANTISLEIKSTDRYILEMFAEAIGADASCVHDFVKRGHSYIRFASDEMSNDLSQYGVVPRKSKITILPKLSDEMMPHLIRGIFDGDGTVTVDKREDVHFAFYGSEQICVGIRDYLHRTIGINENSVSKSTCYHVWWGGKTPSQKFSHYIYDSCGKYFLERKRVRFQQ